MIKGNELQSSEARRGAFNVYFKVNETSTKSHATLRESSSATLPFITQGVGECREGQLHRT